MRILKLLMVPFILVSCGRFEKRETPDVNPQEQSIKVGSKYDYLLDPNRSSNLLTAGKLSVEVLSKDETTTKLKIDGKVRTPIGDKNINLIQPLPNEILTMKFLESFRQNKAYVGKDFKMDYMGVVGNCEEIYIHDMKGFEWLRIKGLLCLITKNVPEIKARFFVFGQTLEGVFLLNN
jgi:hypothetical protein